MERPVLETYTQINDILLRELDGQIDSIFEEIRGIRRYLHMNPELGFETQNTQRVVTEFLTREGIEIVPGEIGVLGLIRGASDTLIALRADMDALPLQEENDIEYRSTVPGRMHACGHDGHTAMLLGAAKLLKQHREKLSHSVLLVFQPAEEGPNMSGARDMLPELERSGLAKRIAGIFGLHLFNDYALGTVGIRYGSMFASTDEFYIKILGKGGHAGLPHRTVDAISVGSKFVCDMESFMSRRVSPTEPAVFSVGVFKAGSAINIVSESATISGTIRCHSEETRALILESMERILTGLCDAFQAGYQLDVVHGLPVLINDGALVTYAKQAACQAVGAQNVFEVSTPNMGAEDFAYFAQRFPAAYAVIGSANPDKGYCVLGHNPKFDFDEDAMRSGIKLLCCIALGASA